MSKIIFNGVDYAGGSGNYFNPVIYSDTERKIGVWRDNKPLYAKTLNPSVNVGSNTINHGIANLEKCVRIYGVCKYNNTSEQLPLPYVSTNTAYNIACGNVTSTTYLVDVGTGFSSIQECYVTLFYTKTTDVAGSGNWNTDGVPTVHYSTSEQVIGTWIDGKPLYMRSYKHTLANAPDEDMESFYVGDVPSDIDTLVKMDGTVKSPNAYAFCGTTGLPYVVGWNYSFHLNPSNHLAVWSTGNYSYYQHIAGGVAVVTIQYTKTTD